MLRTWTKGYKYYSSVAFENYSASFFATYFSWNSISSLFSSELSFQESSSDFSLEHLEKVHRPWIWTQHAYARGITRYKLKMEKLKSIIDNIDSI